jgi:adenylate cyclase
MSRLSKALTFGFLTGILGLVMSLFPYGLNLAENIGLDLLFELRGVRQAPPDVIVVSMDKLSAGKLHLPNDPEEWPRSLHALLIENLAKAGAAVIAFDSFFEDAGSTENDNLFANAISNSRNVVLSEIIKRDTMPLNDKGKSPIGDLNIEKLVTPMPLLAQSSIALAPFPLPKVPVKVRQYWTFKTSAGDTPTLPVVVFQVFALEIYDDFIRILEKVSPSQTEKLPHNKDEIITTGSVEKVIRVISDIFKNEPLAAEIMLKELRNSSTFSDEKKNQLLKSLIRMYQSPDSQYLNFYGFPRTVTTIPYYKVIEPREKAAVNQKKLNFKGKAVFVGLSESMRLVQKDGFYTVFSQSDGLDISGVEIAATAFANLLEDMPVRPLRFQLNIATIFLWGLLIGIFSRTFPAIISAVSIIGVSVLYLFAVLHQFTISGIWYPLVVPLFFQAPLAFFCALVCKYIDSYKERNIMTYKAKQYLPEEVVKELSKKNEDIDTISQTAYGIFLCTDIADFTIISEGMDPEKLRKLMNKYFNPLSEVVTQHGGVVASTPGDAMLVRWVAKYPDAALRKQACFTALDITKEVLKFNQSSDVELRTRIGLHSGFTSFGNIGSIHHYEYGPVGDVVTTATRIEGLNKHLGTQILSSEEVLNQDNGFLTREVGKFVLAGKSKPLVLHEIIGLLEGSTRHQINLCAFFSDALDTFKKQSWEEASGKFNDLINIYGEDGPSLFYLKLCEQYREKPPVEWRDGVVSVDKK